MHIKMKLITAILLVIILVLIIIMVSVMYNRPKEVIERTIKIKFPSNTDMVNYTVDKEFGYLYYEAKIFIPKDSINNVKDQLSNYFGKPIVKIDNKDIPNFGNVCSWWDLKKEDIYIYYYKEIMNPKRIFMPVTKVREVWAFIYESINDEYYLYISY